ncbi:MAG: hypothetical protein U0136_06440 [Bdellovibrionota bacterium]
MLCLFRTIVLSCVVLACTGCDVQFQHSPTEKLALSPSSDLEGAWWIQSDDATDQIYLIVRAIENQELSALYVEAKSSGGFDTIELRASAFEVDGERYFSGRTIPQKARSGEATDQPIQFLVARYQERNDALEISALSAKAAESAIKSGKLSGNCKESDFEKSCSVTSSADDVIKFLAAADNQKLFDKRFELHRLRKKGSGQR